MDEINEILMQMAKEDPNIASLFRDVTTTPMTRFPKGFRWHYYGTGKHPRFREAYFCWSITRNENNKFISWVYDWKGKRAYVCLVREHVRKKDAAHRALKLYHQRMAQIQATKTTVS